MEEKGEGREETYLPSETESVSRAHPRRTPLAHEVDIGNLRFDYRICLGSGATPRRRNLNLSGASVTPSSMGPSFTTPVFCLVIIRT